MRGPRLSEAYEAWKAGSGVRGGRAPTPGTILEADYQAKLDAARDCLDKGDITERELNETKADLTATMPDAVRQKLGLEKPKADAALNAPSPLDGMDTLMQQTGLGTANTSGPQRADRQTASTPAPF